MPLSLRIKLALACRARLKGSTVNYPTLTAGEMNDIKRGFGPEIGKIVDEYGLRDIVIEPSVAIGNVPPWFYTRSHVYLSLRRIESGMKIKEQYWINILVIRFILAMPSYYSWEILQTR